MVYRKIVAEDRCGQGRNRLNSGGAGESGAPFSRIEFDGKMKKPGPMKVLGNWMEIQSKANRTRNS